MDFFRVQDVAQFVAGEAVEFGVVGVKFGAEANAFLFAAQDEIAGGDVLRRAIWWQAEREKPMALFDT